MKHVMKDVSISNQLESEPLTISTWWLYKLSYYETPSQIIWSETESYKMAARFLFFQIKDETACVS